MASLGAGRCSDQDCLLGLGFPDITVGPGRRRLFGGSTCRRERRISKLAHVDRFDGLVGIVNVYW